MFFANPWGLLGLLSLPAIVAIHMFQRRFPPLRVAGLHLWGVESEVREAGRKRERLPITPSLLLELLAALLLTLVLSQPRLGSAGTVTHLVVILDNSASMQAERADGKSFRDLAIEQLETRFAELPTGSVATIILTGQRPTMLAGPEIPLKEAKQKLANWKPSAQRHDFQPAWDLAAQFAADTGQLLFLTDAVPQPLSSAPQTLDIVAVGSQRPNVGFTAARWSLEPVPNRKTGRIEGYRGRIFLRIRNFGSDTADVVVRAETVNQQQVFQRDVTLPALKATSVSVDVPGGVQELVIQLTTDNDGLELDNTVRLVEPSARNVRVAVTLKPSSVAYQQVNRVLEIIPYVERVTPSKAHLIIGPAETLPKSQADLWWLGIGPLKNTDEARKKSVTPSNQYPFVIDKQNQLLEEITLEGVKWGGVQPLNLEGTSLITAGPYPLLMQLHGTRTTAFVMNIDLARSTLKDSGDWPVFIQNLIDLRRDALPGLTRRNFRMNEDVRFRPPSTDGSEFTNLKLHQGESVRPLLGGDVILVPALDQTGVYEIRSGEKIVERFAVNFLDHKESSLADRSEGRRLPEIEPPSNAFLLDQPHSWLILAAIIGVAGVLFANWWSLQTKRQQRASQ
ncbi:MAG: BatA and WFA domain-containing protein [Planctomycetaceae bacterium]